MTTLSCSYTNARYEGKVIHIMDIHELFRTGFLEEMMTGVFNGTQITEDLMLLGAS